MMVLTDPELVRSLDAFERNWEQYPDLDVMETQDGAAKLLILNTLYRKDILFNRMINFLITEFSVNEGVPAEMMCLLLPLILKRGKQLSDDLKVNNTKDRKGGDNKGLPTN